MLKVGDEITSRDGRTFKVTEIEDISYHHKPPSRLVTLVQMSDWGGHESLPFTKWDSEIETGEFEGPSWIWG